MIKRICIGGPLNKEVAFTEPVDRFTAVLMLEGLERERHEYRRVHVIPGGSLDVAIFAHRDVSDECAVWQACLTLEWTPPNGDAERLPKFSRTES